MFRQYPSTGQFHSGAVDGNLYSQEIVFHYKGIALNKALNDNAKLSDLEMHTVEIKKNTGTITDRTRCDNCLETTQGIKNVTSEKK